MGRRFFVCFGAIEEQVEETKVVTKDQLPTNSPQQELLRNSGSLSGTISKEDEQMTSSALNNFRAKEVEIEKRKKEVQDRLLSQLGRVEQETKRLANIREELETFADPVGKELTTVRKKVDSTTKELVSLGQTCQRKEREYKEAMDTLHEKNKEKDLLVTKLKELVAESENWRMKKLEELSKHLLVESTTA